jgi:hypothetical protein
VGAQFVSLAGANPLSAYSFTMPEEYIDYTIFQKDGSLWAKVDGTYPLTKFEVDCQDQAPFNEFTFNEDFLPLVYPTPPGTANISLELNGTDLAWDNFTQMYPDATHNTALGYWTMISCTIDPVPDNFTLKIHYQHPIEMVNGTPTFLYDLNISPYLSDWSNKSTAHFNIKFETEITDLQVNTIATDGTLNQVDYTTAEEEGTESVTLQLVSEYYKPLLGDLLISFKEANNSDSSSSSLPPEYSLALVAVPTIAIIAVVGYLSLRHKQKEKA